MGGSLFAACAKGAVSVGACSEAWGQRRLPVGIRAVGLMLASCRGLPRAQMKYVETEHLRLAYFDPAAITSFRTPRSASSTALRGTEGSFGYVPDGKVSVLLQDFSDPGNATILGSPRNRIFVDIAPTGPGVRDVQSGRAHVYVRQSRTRAPRHGGEANERDRRLRRWSRARSRRWPSTPRAFSIST